MPSEPTTGAHYARYSDGKSAAARDARVSLDLSGIEIVLDNGGAHLRWPYETLNAGEPIRPQSVDVLLSSRIAPGETVFVPSAAFTRELASRTPHLSAGAQRWRHARPWVIGSAAVAALAALIHFTGWSPSQSVARLLPESWRDRLGTAAISSMAGERHRCINPVGLAALDRIASRLSQAAGDGEAFRIVVVDWDLLNAFAVPGNQIVMTRELIEKAESPDEVAGVLAHEMGHGIELHPETGIIRAIGLSAAVELMMGGSGGTIANVGLVLAQLGYTRVAEREADQHAIALLRKSGISTAGLTNFFKRVAAEEISIFGDDGENAEKGPVSSDKPKTNPFDLLRTHPPSTERAELLRDQPPYPSTPALDDDAWRNLKSVCASTTPPG